jgi:uncharacterized protein YjbJ (UPF0337 family)
MGEFTDKLKGTANEVAGKGKQVVGDATDRPDIEAEGAAQETHGIGQNLKGAIKGVFGDKI